jgi:hypothetical protein
MNKIQSENGMVYSFMDWKRCKIQQKLTKMEQWESFVDWKTCKIWQKNVKFWGCKDWKACKICLMY